MDKRDLAGRYIKKESKTYDAVYFLGRYVDPRAITGRIEEALAAIAVGGGIIFSLFLIFT